MSAFPRLFILVSVLVSQLAFGQATGAPDAVRRDTTLPFVNDTGLISSTLRVSDVVRELGPPDSDRVTLVSVENGKRRGDDRTLGYAQRGLSFLVEHEQRKDKDPLVSTMTVASPSVARTPAGLFVGMPEAAALSAAGGHYLVTRDFRSNGTGTVHLVDKKKRSPRSVTIGFEKGVLSTLAFTTRDGPVFSVPRVRAGEVLALVLVALAIGYVWAKLLAGGSGSGPFGPSGRWLPVVLAPGSEARNTLRHGVGLALLGFGIALIVFSGQLFDSGDGYTRLAGLVVGLTGVSGLFYAALVLSGSKNRVVSILASAVVVVFLVAAVASKFVR